MKKFSFLRKLIVLTFTFMVFATVYAITGQTVTFSVFGKVVSLNINAKREILTYMGIMLMVTLVYLELLIVRDHLWVIEGGSQEIRRWRDTFFNKETLYRMKVRKMVVVIFSTIIFTWVYMRTRGSEIFSFLGIILMITVLYFEVLSMRDDLKTLCDAFKAKEIEDAVKKNLAKDEKKDTVVSSDSSNNPQPKKTE